MNKISFNNLSQVQQLLLIMETGRLVMERKEPDRLQKLYVFNEFYVEVVYAIKKNKVIKLHTPEMEFIVDEYLDALSVKDLLDL